MSLLLASPLILSVILLGIVIVSLAIGYYVWLKPSDDNGLVSAYDLYQRTK